MARAICLRALILSNLASMVFARLSAFALCDVFLRGGRGILIRELLSVLFRVSAAGQRIVVSLLAHVCVHRGIICRTVVVRPAGLASTASLAYRPHS